MKFEKNAKYNTNALLVLIVVAFAALLFSIVINIEAFSAFWSKVFSVMKPIIYAFLLMLVLSPIVDYFEKKFIALLKKFKNYHKKARVLAVVCTYVIFLAVLTLVVLIIVSQASKAYLFIAKFADEYFPVLTGFIANISDDFAFLEEHLNSLASAFNETVQAWLANVPDLAKSLAGTLGNIVSWLSDWLLGAIISIYALFRREKLKAILNKANAALFSEKASGHISHFFGELYKNLGCFFSSRAYNMIAIAVAYYLVLLVMGLEFFSLIALVIAVCSFVPVVGTLIGGAIGTFIVLVTEPDIVLRFIVVFIVLTFMDYLYLRPYITNKRIHVSFGTTLISVFVGYFLGDLLGALFALPLYVTLRDIFINWKIKKKSTKETVKNAAE